MQITPATEENLSQEVRGHVVLIRPTQPGLQGTKAPRAPAAATQQLLRMTVSRATRFHRYPHPPSASAVPAACDDANVWSWCFFGSFQFFMGFLKSRWWPYWVCREYGCHMLVRP